MLFVSVSARATSAQDASTAFDAAALPIIQLRVISAIELAGIDEQFLSSSTCSADGKGFLTRLIGSTGEGDVRFISNDGKTVVALAANKIIDVRNPVVRTFFAGELESYLMVVGSTPQGKVLTLRKPNGQTEIQQAVVEKTYISRFSKSGSYISSVVLELPLTPMQFGAFRGGSFLVAGANKGTNEPRIALVKSTGQLDRFLQLKGDIHAPSDSAAPNEGDGAGLPLKSDNYMETLPAAEGFSTIVPDGNNLLLVRPGQKTPVFSISPGGAVRAVPIDFPKGFDLFDLKAGLSGWIALYTRKISPDPKDGRLETEIYALNPVTGKATAKYVFPDNLGVALACTDGPTFTVLTREQEKLQLISVSH